MTGWLQGVKNAALDAVELFLPDCDNIILERTAPGVKNIHDENTAPVVTTYTFKALIIPAEHRGIDMAIGLEETINAEAVWTSANEPPLLGDIVIFNTRRFKIQSVTPYTLDSGTEIFTSKLIAITDN